MEQNPSPGLHLRCNVAEALLRRFFEERPPKAAYASPTRGEVIPSKPQAAYLHKGRGGTEQAASPEKPYFAVSNEHAAPPPAFCRISLGSMVQSSFEKLSKFDPA